MILCPNCGRSAEDGAAACPNCGAPVARTAPTPGRAAGPSVGRGLGCGLSFLLFMGGIAAGGYFDSLTNGAFTHHIGFMGLPWIVCGAAAFALYFALRSSRPLLARGIGYGLLIGLSLLLGATAICGGFRPVGIYYSSPMGSRQTTPVPSTPSPPLRAVVPTSQQQPQQWRYTTHPPSKAWFLPGFDASGWKEGPGGFGTEGTPGAVVRTTWNTQDIWLRREFVLPPGAHPDLQFLVYHDEDVDIYVNGVLAAQEAGYKPDYETLAVRPAAKVLLSPGAKITLAVHCHQTTGGQDIDVGLVDSGR